MIAIITAYALLSFGLISSNSLPYIFLNLSGAIGVIILSVAKGVKQSVILNIFWAAIALYALTKLIIVR